VRLTEAAGELVACQPVRKLMCLQGLEDATGLYANRRADVQQLIWRPAPPNRAVSGGLFNLQASRKRLSFRELTSRFEILEEVA
jgi:hypothetical protein